MVSKAPAATYAAEILKALAASATGQSATALAQRLGIPRASVYRVLEALEAANFVTHFDDSRRWGLGPGVYELGTAYTRSAPLQRRARSLMTQLAETTQECSHLAVLHGTDVLYVIEERPLGRPPLVSDVGVRLPASLTASGLAMLAQLPAAQIRALYPNSQALVRRTFAGIETVTQLRSALAQTRQRGYAVEEDSVTPGFLSVAAPVLDRHGLPVASVAVTWEARRAHTATPQTLAQACQDTAAQLAQRLTS